ncbi:hypothetical protein IFM89_011687 [Coptis chinensis]|uniref:Uncharacterized protein n=1 Tax=Coptis chinensis TaxID=261450 RepID=A0A835LDI7_9MAGN|nr:hypothetical protein IFM89_011687 [Coptis chinensis]
MMYKLEQKKARFPKGKKVKSVGDDDELPPVAVSIGPSCETVDLSDPQEAAKERATTELFIEQGGKGILKDVSAAEVTYKIQLTYCFLNLLPEAINLSIWNKRGRKAINFDDDGNFVEYVRENEVKDAWLDSVIVDSRHAEKKIVEPNTEEEIPDLSSDDIGKMKRRIADLLEPEETVKHLSSSGFDYDLEKNALQALRRLKGTSTDRKEKMPEDIKHMFDQLIEDSMKLMENGNYS